MKFLHTLSIVLALFAAFFAAPHCASAQTAVYAMFTGASSGPANSGNMYGPTLGAYFDRGTFINYGVDIRGAFLRNGNNTQFDSGMGGLRLSVKPHIIPFNPYAELLGGIAHSSYPGRSGNNFAYEFNIGADFTLLPHLDWRVLEFSDTTLTSSNNISPKALSTGLVFRFF
ncbi:MAG: outer membrane beta-barrel protein [Acidobacteriaceae bacterium]